MKTRIILSLALAICLTLSLFVLTGCNDQSSPSGGGGGTSAPGSGGGSPPPDNRTFHFNVSFPTPESSAVAMVQVLDRIQEASNGRITMTYYYSWSLTSVATIIDDFNSGIVDIGVHSFENDTFFPYSNLITNTPFLGMPGLLETARIYDEIFAEHPALAQEFARNGLVFWTPHPIAEQQLYTNSDFAIRVPGDLNGRRFTTNLVMLQQFLARNGAAGVSAPVTELASMVNTGVVDGVLQHPGVILSFGLEDFIEGATLFGNKGILSAMMSMSFSEHAWNSMPTDLQKLFVDEAETLREEQGQLQIRMNYPVNDRLSASVPVQVLSDAEIQVWVDDFSDIIDAHVEDMIRRGHSEAREILDAVRTKIAERS